jgi:diguanylate cyclase (GGDEF)-like protein
MEAAVSERGAVLIVSDDVTTSETLYDFLVSAGHVVGTVRSDRGLHAALKARQYDVVVLDTLLNDGKGLDLIPPIKRFDYSVEIIAVTEIGAAESAMRTIGRGASSYVQRPVRLSVLLNRVQTALTVRSFLRRHRIPPTEGAETASKPSGGLVCVERLLQFDRELMSIMDYRLVIDSILAGIASMAGADVAAALVIREKVTSIVAYSGVDAQATGRREVFEQLSDSWDAFGGNALQFDDVLWSGLDEDSRGPIMEHIVQPLMIQDVLVGALGAFTTSEIPLSASSHALLPIIAGRAEIVIENAFLHEHTRILATTDSLTGLLNRRVFREGIVREFERSKRLQMYRRSGGDLSVIMLDVDHFKNFNDTYGHQLGDKVLKMVASVLMSIARRATDMVARYGGEEFVMIAPDTSLENARIIAERVRQTLQDTAVESAAGPLHVTASFGVSTYPQCGATSIEALIEQADGAQYRAKNGGRNRVETAPLLHENDDLADTQSS